jgi:nicotinate-nucleotide adenylyltransferase
VTLVFGGSFNPPTRAHLDIIETLLNRYPEAMMILLPVPDDYDKEGLAPLFHRERMLKLMTDGLERVRLSTLEAKQRYQGTLASLKEISKTHTDLRFVIGSDQLPTLRRWIAADELLKSYPFVVINRPGGVTEDEAEVMFKDMDHQFIYIPFSSNLSSTLARKQKDGRDKVLTKAVDRYIKTHHLYEEI